MSEKVKIVKAAGVVGGATLLSRILGFVRDVAIAWYFGAGFSSDAFFVAFRIPNLLRRLFAEGSLSSAFIPVFSDYLMNSGQEEAFRFARSTLRFFAVMLIGVSIAGVLLSPVIIRIIAPGFSSDPGKILLTTRLTRIMFPYIFFIGLVALCMGVLNVLGHFLAPALAPALLNVSMIGSVFLLSPRLSEPVEGLAVGVLVGGLFQLGLQLPAMMRKGVYLWKSAPLLHPGLRKIRELMLPAVFGAAVYQINILVGTLLASMLPEGSVSYLYYADRLVQFPLGIFAIATATAVLPSLSRQAAAKDYAAVEATFVYAMKLVFFITVPAMVGLIVLREPIIALLFKRGAFDARTLRLTAIALVYYGIGLWAFSAVRVVVTTFYALQDTRSPVVIGAVSVIVNLLLGVILMRPMGHGGLALATSLASMLNFFLLMRALLIKLGGMEWKPMAASAIKCLACAGGMGISVSVAAGALIPAGDSGTLALLLGLGGSIVAGILVYGLLSILTKSSEMNELLAFARKGIRTG